MAKFIAISGPASTGKTAIINRLNSSYEMFGSVCSPDIYNTVWKELVDQGYFQEYTEIIRDTEYLCVYLIRVLNYYEEYLDSLEQADNLVVLDTCWIDYLVYATINLWYMKPLKAIEEQILKRILNLSNRVLDRVYFTHYDESKEIKQKFRLPAKVYTIKENIELERLHYKTLENFNNAVSLPTADPEEAAKFIINDLNSLGYL